MATGLAKSLCDAYTVMGEEIDRLRAENERLTGALQEISDTPATPDNHDLVAVVMLAQLALRDENGG